MKFVFSIITVLKSGKSADLKLKDFVMQYSLLQTDNLCVYHVTCNSESICAWNIHSGTKKY